MNVVQRFLQWFLCRRQEPKTNILFDEYLSFLPYLSLSLRSSLRVLSAPHREGFLFSEGSNKCCIKLACIKFKFAWPVKRYPWSWSDSIEVLYSFEQNSCQHSHLILLPSMHPSWYFSRLPCLLRYEFYLISDVLHLLISSSISSFWERRRVFSSRNLARLERILLSLLLHRFLHRWTTIDQMIPWSEWDLHSNSIILPAGTVDSSSVSPQTEGRMRSDNYHLFCHSHRRLQSQPQPLLPIACFYLRTSISQMAHCPQMRSPSPLRWF